MVSFNVFKGSEDGTVREAITQRPLGPDEVLVKVTHSGMCYTDLHYRKVDMALGHEGAGIVEDIGDRVTQFTKGQRVGWGYVHDICQHCKSCLQGREQHCLHREMYGDSNLDQGSFATYSVRKESFLLAIPDGLSLSDAAPLMCGGATVFAALHDYGVKPSHRVGVVGMGGLGHLAVQFAAKMGCEVVVFSSTDSKREEAMRLGATEFCATQGVSDLSAAVTGGKVDCLIVVTGVQPDWEYYFSVLAPEAIIFPMTACPGENLSVPYMPWLMNGTRIQASIIASRPTHQAMLRFAAVHGIKPIVQEFPMTLDGVNEAFTTLKEGRMRYRGVLVVP